MKSAAPPTVLAIALLGCCGCASRQNELRIGDVAPLPSIEPGERAEIGAAASLAGIDRSGWPTVAVLVPVDSVDRRIAGGIPLQETGPEHRVARAFPSAEQAVEVGPPGSFVSLNTVAAPFAAGIDLASLVYRWPAQAAWTRDGDRLDWRERVPRPAPATLAPEQP